jgi:hypothetical protein
MAEAVQEAQSEAAEYDAWFRRKVQEALDEANNGGEVFTVEEMEADDEAWWAEAQRRAGEAGLDALSEG